VGAFDVEQEAAVVRPLTPGDLERVVTLDAQSVGRRREEYFRVKLQQNLQESGIQVSLAAEVDGAFAGFLLARVYYGEFGIMEPVAVLDTLGVHSAFRKRGVGGALLRQLGRNLRALGISRLRTEVDWDEQDLLGFFHRQGFRPASRLCLDLDLETS
jgi:ribosomal protein S18 acetylase RimI-like enzyme